MPDMTVYDKGKYHYEGSFPSGLARIQAFVHIGMFFGWVCESGLLSVQMNDDFSNEILSFQQRKITGAQLIQLCGGVLASDMLNDSGNAFASRYYEDAYLDDYAEVLANNYPTVYHVPDTWEHFDKLALRIDERYEQSLS